MKAARAIIVLLLGAAPALVFFWWMFQGCRFPFLGGSPQAIDFGLPSWGRPVANVGLVCFYGAIHSAFAQAGAPRPFFMVVAGLTALGVIAAWQPTAGELWRLGGDWLAWCWGLGQFLLWLGTQAWCGSVLGLRAFLGMEDRDPALVTGGPYAIVRHPMHSIIIFNLAVFPVITTDRLAMLIGVSLYLFCGGISAEEARMEEEFGDEWRAYKASVPMLIPRFR